MAAPVTLWVGGGRWFILEEKDGGFELTLHVRERVIRAERCESEREARDKAHVWLILLEVMNDK